MSSVEWKKICAWLKTFKTKARIEEFKNCFEVLKNFINWLRISKKLVKMS